MILLTGEIAKNLEVNTFSVMAQLFFCLKHLGAKLAQSLDSFHWKVAKIYGCRSGQSVVSHAVHLSFICTIGHNKPVLNPCTISQTLYLWIVVSNNQSHVSWQNGLVASSMSATNLHVPPDTCGGRRHHWYLSRPLRSEVADRMVINQPWNVSLTNSETDGLQFVVMKHVKVVSRVVGVP